MYISISIYIYKARLCLTLATSGLKASTSTIRCEGGADISVLADDASVAVRIAETGAPGGPQLEATFEGGELRVAGKGWGKGRGARPY